MHSVYGAMCLYELERKPSGTCSILWYAPAAASNKPKIEEGHFCSPRVAKGMQSAGNIQHFKWPTQHPFGKHGGFLSEGGGGECASLFVYLPNIISTGRADPKIWLARKKRLPTYFIINVQIVCAC